MSHYDLEEQEQIANLKAWWSSYGNLLSIILTIVLLAVIAWQTWNWYQNKIISQANSIFANAVAAFDQHSVEATESKAQIQNAAVIRIAGELENKFSNTGYATLSAFMASKVAADNNDLKTAKSQLVWLIDNSSDETLIPIAKLRLANILLDEKNYDEALKILTKSATYDKNFLVSLYDLQGDIYLEKQDVKSARKFWQMAKTEIDTHDYTFYGTEKNYMQFLLSNIENKLQEYQE